MKKLLLILALIAVVPGYSKAIPSPSVLFTISEKILNEAHHFVFPSETDNKQKMKIETKSKIKPVEKAPLLKDTFIWNPSLTLKRDGMWIVAI